MPGEGRPSKRPTIDRVRELIVEEVLAYRPAKNSNPVQRHRDSHHRVARLFAMGLRPGQVAAATGYSLGRITTLAADPAFEELIANYRGMVDESFKESTDEYYDTVASNRIIAARLINDKLADAEPGDVGFRELVLIHSDAADRTGYPKRTVALNVNADFASLLDRAIERSKEVKTISHLPGPTAAGEGGQEPSLPANPGPQPIRRQA